jgi:hypothetical protein
MDLRISELPPLRGEDLREHDLAALADLSASETRQITVKELIQDGIQLIDDGTIPGAKIVDDSITAQQIATDAVTDDELADNAVDTAAIQFEAVTNEKVAYGLDGAKLADESVFAEKISWDALDRGLDKGSGLIGHTNDIQPGQRSGITFDAQGHISAHRALIGTDLPPATETDLGGVHVPMEGGLRISLDGSITHAADTEPGLHNGIQYDEHGHVVGTAPLLPSDLPLATEETVGGVYVPELPLAVEDGALTHADSGVEAGTYTKVAVDQTGHVIEGTQLTEDDVPLLDADKIVSGRFGSDRLALNSVKAEHLCDYSIAHILQQRPKPEFAGQWWINPIDRSAYIWVGTVDGPDTVENGYWMNLGYGSAVDQNARFGGTYDAELNVVEAISTLGNSGGIVVGNPLPPPAQQNAGMYLIVVKPGVGTSPAPGEALGVGDWVFSLGNGSNWIKVGVITGQNGVIRDEDVIVEGSNLYPVMPGVANQEEANNTLWSYCQVASGDLRGTVKPSASVIVDVDGVMDVNVVDEGEF